MHVSLYSLFVLNVKKLKVEMSHSPVGQGTDHWAFQALAECLAD